MATKDATGTSAGALSPDVAGIMTLYRQFYSKEEIDQEYNPAMRIADGERWLHWFQQQSEQTRKELHCLQGKRYGPTLAEHADIFPAEQPRAPILVFIHGGYWRWGTSNDFSLIARGPVHCGMTVVVANYALCPKVTITEISRQSRALIAWLHGQAHRFNGDPERIFVAGHSAGGQQVGMLAATNWAGEYGLPDNVIKGGIPISGLFDLRPLRYSYLQPQICLTHEIIYKESPLCNIPPKGPKLLISVGEQESTEFIRQSQNYLNRWQAAGLEGNFFLQHDKHHFSAIEDFQDAHSPLCREIVDFIA